MQLVKKRINYVTTMTYLKSNGDAFTSIENPNTFDITF